MVRSHRSQRPLSDNKEKPQPHLNGRKHRHRLKALKYGRPQSSAQTYSPNVTKEVASSDTDLWPKLNGSNSSYETRWKKTNVELDYAAASVSDTNPHTNSNVTALITQQNYILNAAEVTRRKQSQSSSTVYG